MEIHQQCYELKDISCQEYFDVRYQCFDVNTSGELFHTVYPDVIIRFIQQAGLLFDLVYRGGRRSPAVACWASDHWVASSNPLRGKFRH